MMKATRASAVVLEEIHIIHVSTVSICIDQSRGIARTQDPSFYMTRILRHSSGGEACSHYTRQSNGTTPDQRKLP